LYAAFFYLLNKPKLQLLSSFSLAFGRSASFTMRLLYTSAASQVGIISASPLSMGLLTHQGPPDWHPAPPELKEAAAAAAACCKDQGVDLSKLALQFAVKWVKVLVPSGRVTRCGACTMHLHNT
jgi:aryl-alcohol dehydrogenase-like predicted oxidoreductase